MCTLAWVNTHQGACAFPPLSAFFVYFLCLLLMIFLTHSRLLEDIKLWVTRKANYDGREPKVSTAPWWTTLAVTGCKVERKISLSSNKCYKLWVCTAIFHVHY